MVDLNYSVFKIIHDQYFVLNFKRSLLKLNNSNIDYVLYYSINIRLTYPLVSHLS